MQYALCHCDFTVLIGKGAERRFWKIDNVYSTQVGYAGGYTPNPTYKEVCTGQTGTQMSGSHMDCHLGMMMMMMKMISTQWNGCCLIVGHTEVVRVGMLDYL